MKFQARAAEDFLRRPDPRIRAALIYGPDEGLVRERSMLLARAIVPDAADPFRIAELTADKIAADTTLLADEANALSMMGGKRLVVLRDATDKVTPACATLSGGGADSLVIVEAGDLGPKSPLRKLFEATPDFACIACYVDDEKSLSGLIRETLHHEHIAADSDAVAWIAHAVTGDRMLVRRALEKLVLYAGADGHVKHLSLDDAMAAIGDAGEMQLDDPARAAADGNRAETDRALRKLVEEGTSAIAILRVAQGYFRRLHIARAATEAGESADAALAALRPPVFFKQAPQFRRQLERWRLPMLAAAITRLVDCEAASKRTGAPDDLLVARAFTMIAQMQHPSAKA